jgi:hypothetical protein
MGIKKTVTTLKHFAKKSFSNPTNATRTLIVTCGTLAAVMPAWRLVTALLTILGAVVSLVFILAATIGLLWLVSHWKTVWRKFSEELAETVSGLFGRKTV